MPSPPAERIVAAGGNADSGLAIATTPREARVYAGAITRDEARSGAIQELGVPIVDAPIPPCDLRGSR